jgi:hypothetical protein
VVEVKSGPTRMHPKTCVRAAETTTHGSKAAQVAAAKTPVHAAPTKPTHMAPAEAAHVTTAEAAHVTAAEAAHVTAAKSPAARVGGVGTEAAAESRG